MSGFMQWKDIAGHSENISRLKLMLQSGRMPHALLFTGAAGIGKMLVARVLAASVLCMNHADRSCGICQSCRSLENGSHPDMLTVRPDGAAIKIEQIRQLQSELALSSYLGSGRVCMIEDAERMTAQAANSMLKMLEEPQGNVLFILVATEKQLLLNTIISRCLAMAFQPLSPALLGRVLTDRGFSGFSVEVAARLAGGRIGQALKLLEPDGLAKRDQAVEIAAALPAGEMKFVWSTAALLDKYERKDFLLLLEYLSLILRDVLMICGRRDSWLLYNVDLEEKLARQAGHWSETGLMKALAAIAACRQAIQANANPRLTGEALLIQLCDLAGGG